MMKKATTLAALISLSLLSATAVAGHHEDGAKAEHHGGEMNHDKKHHKYMKYLDANNDSAVDRAEFMSAAEKRFDKMDKNGDGVIDKNDKHR